ncbi:MAG: hypothetical protein KAQ96_10905 [Thermoplasmata archaeon]|nr:hypothetical protein [Thermoplasmata archaeon]
MAEEKLEALQVLRSDPRFGYIGLALWTAMLVATVVWGVYELFYILFILGYLLVATQMEELASRFKPLRRIVSWSPWHHFILLFLAALAIRWLILLQDQSITGDLETTVNRSVHMMNGLYPYLDFSGGTKPPSYQYMLYLMGVTVGPDPLRFRALFSLADALVAGLVYLACRTRYGPEHSLAMAMIYAMCPVAIITIGLSGRYDGVVNIFLIAALWTLLGKRYDSSAILLGMGCCLKIYPAAVLPFMAVAATKLAGHWDRGSTMRLLGMVRYSTFFVLPVLGSLLPLAMVSPEALTAYFAERGVFEGWGSYTTWMRNVLGVEHMADVHVAYVFLALFGTILLWMFIDWLRNGPVAIRRWIRFTFVAIAVHYGFFLSLGFEYYDVPGWEVYTFLFLTAWMVLVAFVYKRYIHQIELGTDEELSLARSGLPIVGAMALIFFVFAMPTIGTWYYLWPLPFVLLIGPRDVRETMLWLLFWHTVGQGISLLPGMPPLN